MVVALTAWTAVGAVSWTVLPSNAASEPEAESTEAATSAETPDRVMAEAVRRAHPPKKRGIWRIRQDWDETTDFLDEMQQRLHGQDLVVGFDAAFYNQYASKVRKGGNNAATFAWQLFIDYEVYKTEEHGDFHLTGTFLGSVGADYDDRGDPLSDRVGSVSILNGNVYPDVLAVDELYAHWISEEAEWVLAVGKLDMSYFFDTNRVANDAYRQFTAFTLENDISIPFPIYGGFGTIGRWNPSEDTYVMLGAGDASSDERVPWGSVTDGSWWELAEVGITFEPEVLGTGNYRLTGWHSDSGPGNGFGFGINLDQNLGREWLVGFFRAGFGDPSQTDVKGVVSGGLSFQGPFGRKNDEAGIGLSWADPSGGDRNEKFLETFYRFAITRRLSVSPFLQIVVDPSDNPKDDSSVIGAIRLLWML